jgi:hypothetical protein
VKQQKRGKGDITFMTAGPSTAPFTPSPYFPTSSSAPTAVLSATPSTGPFIHPCCNNCKGITQTLIPNTSAVKPKASQSTDGNLLWSVVYISDTACLRAGADDDTQPALADPHPLRRPWPVTGGYAASVP